MREKAPGRAETSCGCTGGLDTCEHSHVARPRAACVPVAAGQRHATPLQRAALHRSPGLPLARGPARCSQPAIRGASLYAAPLRPGPLPLLCCRCIAVLSISTSPAVAPSASCDLVLSIAELLEDLAPSPPISHSPSPHARACAHKARHRSTPAHLLHRVAPQAAPSVAARPLHRVAPCAAPL